MQPFNYSLGVQSPFEAAATGFQFGQNLQTQQAQRAAFGAQEQAALAKIQEQQKAAERKQAFDQRVAGMFGRTLNYSDLVSLKQDFPDMLESVDKAWANMSEPEAQRVTTTLNGIFQGIATGNKDIAAQYINDEMARAQNSGDPDRINQASKFKQLVDKNTPESWNMLQQMAGTALAPRLGKDGAESLSKVLQTPSTVKQGQVKAEYAESAEVLDLKQKGWNIEKIKADILSQKEQNRIAALNAATSREGNALKRAELQLKLDEAVAARDQKIRDKVAEAESARSTMDNMLSNADRILSVAVGKDGKPTSVLRAAAGPVDAITPTIQTDVADLEALVETLGSQAFLAQIPSMKGTGSLTEKEGDKLQAALTNLNLKQSPEQLVANIKEAQRLIQKARKNVTIRYGIPDTPEDRPYLSVSKDEVDSLLKQYGGK